MKDSGALSRLDPDALIADAAALLRIPSPTGDERAALTALAELATSLGLAADQHQHDLAALRAHPDHPGEEAARDALWGLTITRPGERPGRLALNGTSTSSDSGPSRGATTRGPSRTGGCTDAARST